MGARLAQIAGDQGLSYARGQLESQVAGGRQGQVSGRSQYDSRRRKNMGKQPSAGETQLHGQLPVPVFSLKTSREPIRRPRVLATLEFSFQSWQLLVGYWVVG